MLMLGSSQCPGTDYLYYQHSPSPLPIFFLSKKKSATHANGLLKLSSQFVDLYILYLYKCFRCICGAS